MDFTRAVLTFYRVNNSLLSIDIATVLEEHGSRRKTSDLFNPLNARTHSAVFPVKSDKALEPTVVVCNITSNFPERMSPCGWVPNFQ